MNRGIGSEKLVDLTPLLDVVLILLFALLMNMSIEQEAYKDTAEELAEEVAQKELEKEELNRLLEQRDVQIAELNDNVEMLVEQDVKLSEAVVTWFASEDIREAELVTSDDFEKILDKNEANQSLYQMDFIANQFFFVEIDFDRDNFQDVLINGVSTGVQLTFDKRNNQAQLEQAYDDIFDEVEKVMTEKDGGYRFVLFTLTDNGYVYSYAYDLVWSVIKDIETKYTDDTIYKLQYLDYD